MRPTNNLSRPKTSHFTSSDRAAACDHCTFFKGIVHRSHAQRRLGDDTLTTRSNNMLEEPRSLESIALQEAVIEKRDHAKYMKWSQARVNANLSAERKEGDGTEISTDKYTEQSDTLAQWLEHSTKEELLSFLRSRNDDNDNMDDLMYEGAIDLREYILGNRNAKKTPKNAIATVSHIAASGAVKKPNAHREKTEQRLQAHKSLKPPQAALRDREELRRWYYSKQAPALQDELRKRGIKPARGRKADMINRLVEDDKKITTKP